MSEKVTVSKSLTRLLQHSILQLCNEHIGYSHKLQILGVLCMTVDDEQQELVVKVNNTLKRVNPASTKDNIPHEPPAPPGGEQITREVGEVTRMSSPSQLVVGGRRSHGRKGANPVKVQQVFEDGENSDEDEDGDEPITVIPTAPEAAMSPSSVSHSPVSMVLNPKQSMLATNDGRFGSAKRKPSHQFRVPPYSSPGSPYMSARSLPDSAGSPYAMDLSRQDDAGSEDSSYGSTQANNSNSNASTSQTQPTQGLSLPIYVAGTYVNDSAGSKTNDRSEHGASENSEIGSGSRLTQMDGADPRDEDGMDDSAHINENDVNHREGSPGQGPLYVDVDDSGIRVKDEPQDDRRDSDRYMRYDYLSQMDTSSEDYGPQNLSKSFRLDDSRLSGTPDRNDSLIAHVAYSGIGLLNSLSQAGSSTHDGLSIAYTSTGPYTVGANGRDVSNSSRIKDIIMYDDQSPPFQQKGNRIETDYIVDKLGLGSRKRRRRAPEDQLTAEEIAEYLGQGNESTVHCFKCKYCSEEFMDVTRYIQHTLAAHSAYICHQCGKSFTTKSSLLRHRPIHTGMRRFACSICKKTFYRKDKCKAHIKRHLGTDQNMDKYPALTDQSMDKYPQLENVHIELE